MEIIAVFSKKLFHGKLAVGTFESLKNNPCIGIIQRVNRLKLLRRHNVKNLLPGVYFVFSHIRGQFHPFLIEFYDLFVNFINIFSDI